MKTRSQNSPLKALIRLRTRGQATVEYALVTHFLLIGGGLLLMPIIADFFNSLSLFFESLFFVLNTAAI